MTRECGSCTLCCKLLGIKELKKPAGVWCNLVQIGTGCGQYETRPQSCRDFSCLWLQGVLPLELKPSEVRAVFSMTTDNAKIVVFVDPGYPDAPKTGELGRTLHRISTKVPVIVICGDKRKMLLPQGMSWEDMLV